MTTSLRVDQVAQVVREIVPMEVMAGRDVYHYSIPAFDALGEGQVEPGDDIGSAKLRVRGGELLVSRLNPRKSRVLITRKHPTLSVCSSEFVVLRPRADADARFLRYTFLAEHTRQLLDSATQSVTRSQQRVDPEVITKLSIPALSIGEQPQIAAFLDTEVGRIEALVAARQRQIALMIERSQALIERTVWLDETGGARPVMGLRRVASRIDVGIAEAATHAYRESGTPLLRSANIRRAFLELGDLLFIDPEFARRRASKTIRGGDLITVRTGNVGVTAVVPQELDGSQCFTQLITTPLPSASSQFLCMALNSGRAVEYFKLLGWGSAQANISVPTLAAAPIPDVPTADQLRLVRELDEPIARMEALVVACSKQADLFIERRQALITAAVTGQLDLAREIAEELT